MTQELAQSTEFQVALHLDGLSTDGVNQHHLGGFIGAPPLAWQVEEQLALQQQLDLMRVTTSSSVDKAVARSWIVNFVECEVRPRLT